MEKELNELTDQELLEKRKKSKSEEIINAVILGVLIGIAIYGTIKYGLGLFTFLPVLFALYAANKWKKNSQTLEKELHSRNLK
ncbi:FUSC family protein [Chryseobacterium sp. MIQD13]|uniref:FUSC family protein n=1 Tax=Chryseobacterium sp. MIQD13 TaxID=3422310 RepID=UPI003D29E362